MAESVAAGRRRGRIAALGLALAGLVSWGASRLSWLTAFATDDKSGEVTAAVTGASWATETTAVALLLLAGAVAGLVLRRIGRRVVGLACAFAGAGLAWVPVSVLSTGVDYERVRSLLSTGATTSRASDPVPLSSWAEVYEVVVHPTGPIIALIAAAVAVLSGVVLALRPGPDPAKLDRYERRQQRRIKIDRDLAENPTSGRALWDALDAEIDPTEQERGPRDSGEES